MIGNGGPSSRGWRTRRHGSRRTGRSWAMCVVAVASIAVGSGALAGCGSSNSSSDATTGESAAASSSQTSGMTTVTFASPGVTNGPAQATYTSLPKVLNLYKQAGVDVKEVDYDGASQVVQALELGKADIGMVATPQLFELAGQKEGSPLVAVFTNTTSQLVLVGVLPGSDITSPKQFEGKTIGVVALTNSDVEIVKAMCKEAGCDPSTIKFVPVGQGATAAAALKNGRVQVLATFDSGLLDIERAGVKMRLIPTNLLQKGPNSGFATALTVKKSALKDPKMRKAFIAVCKAQAEAAVFATTNPSAAVQIAWQVYPDSKPTGVSTSTALSQGIADLKARLANMQPVEGQWGLATSRQIKTAMKIELLSGDLKAPVQISDIWDPSLLKQINDFKPGPVKAAAKAWKP